MREGAYDFVAKPFPFERLIETLNRALEKRGLVLENRKLVAIAAEGAHELPLIGASRAITALRATIAQIAPARMDVLIEVHDEAELDRAALLKSPLIGINNRNLHTFEVTLHTTRRLARRVPEDRMIVAESGLYTPDDLADLAQYGARCFLIGESLMRQGDVTAATRAILAKPLTAQGGL